jgi:hypothetical protein
MLRTAVLCVLALIMPVESLAQTIVIPATPRTKMEAFEAQPDAVIVRSFVEIGRISYYGGGTLVVQARELNNALTGKKESGIAVIINGADQFMGGEIALIDEDEIPSLLKAIDQMGGIHRSTTTFEEFRASYRTTGDFVVGVSGSVTNGWVSVSSGESRRTATVFDIGNLTVIRDLISGAQDKLDSIKGVDKRGEPGPR